MIAVLEWLRAFLFALGGLALIGVGHLSARLVSAVATDSIFEKRLSFLGKSLGLCALLVAAVFVAAGLGLWLFEELGASLTLTLDAVWLFFDLIVLMRHVGPNSHRPRHHRCCRSRLSSIAGGQEAVYCGPSFCEMKDFGGLVYDRKRLCRVCT